MKDIKALLKERYRGTEQDIVLDGADVVSQQGYTLLPNYVLYMKDLTPHAKLIYATLLSYAWGRKRSSFPGQARLANDCGMGVATVKRHIKRLVEKQCIAVIRRGQGRTNLYILHFKKR
jgi:hypothetical protein